MARLVSRSSKRGFLSVFWDQFTSLDPFTKMFMVIAILIVGVVPYFISNYQTIYQHAASPASRCYFQPVACPMYCVKGRACPKCPPPKFICPSITPTPPGGCYYAPVACPMYCIAGQPCPTCAPKLVCPTPTPIALMICGSPDYSCPAGYTCGHCTGAILEGQPTPEPDTGCVCIPSTDNTQGTVSTP